MNGVKRYFVPTTRGDLYVAECGVGERVVVIVTITSFGGVLLDRVLPLLADRHYRVIAIDLMGYGRSDKRDAVWLVEDFADNLLEAFRFLDLVPERLVCGHFSSWMGIELASRKSSCLRALVLDGTPIIAPSKRAGSPSLVPVSPVLWEKDGSHALEYWMKASKLLKTLDPSLQMDGNPSARVRAAYLALLEAISFEPGTAEAAQHFDIESKLPRIAIPTLVMCSDTDWNLPHYPAVLSAIPNARGLRLAGVHPLHALLEPERAIEYVGHLSQFFEDVGL